MEFSIKEYEAYHEEEILPLYESVGWTNYIRKRWDLSLRI